MNRYVFLLVLLMTIVIPGIVYRNMYFVEKQEIIGDSVQDSISDEPLVSVLTEGEMEWMQLEEYIQCVILGEIPMNFETETLKAQAVAVRTYSLKSIERHKNHNGADLCSETNCCQAFCSVEDYLQKGGSQTYVERVRDAVTETTGEVLLYDEILIEATYFSASGGRTEAAAAVWGSEIPYLQSVQSEGEPPQLYEKRYSQKEFLEKLDLAETNVDRISCSEIVYTEGNGVASVTVCGRKFTGKEIRQYLELPSTVFEISVTSDYVVVLCEGNGHRVGMSQYGAEAMAKSGKNYIQILAHYYPGTKLYQMSEKEIKGIFDKAGKL